MSVIASDSPVDEKRAESRVGTASSGSNKTDLEIGGETSLPPPPKLSAAEEKKLWRKIDLRLMPILSMMYLMSFMDRGMYNILSTLFLADVSMSKGISV
jgi:hypothetical protein